HHHGDIDENIEKEVGGEPESQEASELIICREGNGEAVKENQAVHPQQRESADQPELLREHRKDEVGLSLRQEVEVALSTFEKSLAEDTSRPKGDLGLHDVVAGAERIGRRVEEHEHSASLVVVKQT